MPHEPFLLGVGVVFNLLTTDLKILERAGPVIFKTFFTGINSFQTDSSNLSCKKEQSLKITGNDS